MKVLKYLDFVNEGKTTRVYDIKWTKEKCTEVAKKYNSLESIKKDPVVVKEKTAAPENKKDKPSGNKGRFSIID